MAQGPAMSCEEACKAVIAGIETVRRLADMGYNIIASGEMGIGNTTPTAAITCVLTGLTPDEITGRGAGLSDEGLVRKKAVIKKALHINQPDKSDAIDVLSKVGGLEIAGMTGLFLGGALCRIPVIIDVSVSSAAAVLASMLCPAASDYMLASNLGKEPTAVHLNRLLGARPVICADMALGEGSGAVMLFPLLDMALNVYRRNNTFDDINITAYERFDS
jgi:nicotinate-nucleotide--dimethylbenzimidazole phosphoribosyltransferase